MDFQLNQHPIYNFSPIEPIFTFVTEVPFTDEKSLYELSLLREPRERNASTTSMK